MQFILNSETPDCGVIFYDKNSGEEINRVPFEETERTGIQYIKEYEIADPEHLVYLFYRGGELLPDQRGKIFPGLPEYGRERKNEDLKAGFVTQNFDWGKDTCPRIPYEEALVYCMHVRGFTKHASSGVTSGGTFCGIREKIPYLKEIGITTIELQPAYEFQEVCTSIPENYQQLKHSLVNRGATEDVKKNYWGYCDGYYYAPKKAYAATEDPITEFCTLVHELHNNQMEVVMQFYFPDHVNRNDITDILHFWVNNYHLDGFHLMGNKLPIDLIATDPKLMDKKLFFYEFDDYTSYQGNRNAGFPHLAMYNDSYMYDMRRFLKGDENMLATALKQFRFVPINQARIHYYSNYYGLTLADMVSYDHKHNEGNQENNHDGTDYNCSWNCGEEGPTKSRKIRQLRIKQIKNAMCMLLFTQTTPLIFMGDEFGNTQGGNNNPYCQDNEITWLDWSLVKKNHELLDFWKMLTDFRKKHSILHRNQEPFLADTLSCGFPDLSYHGESAWKPQIESYSRHIGIMYCEEYANITKPSNEFVYIGINMHWEPHQVALPKLPKDKYWEEVFTTGQNKETLNIPYDKNTFLLEPRSILAFVSRSFIKDKAKAQNNRTGRRKIS